MDDLATPTIELQRVVDVLPDHVAVLRLDRDDLVFVVANEVLAAGLDRTPEDLAGHRLSELQSAQAVRTGVELAAETLAQGRPLQREVRVDQPGRRHVLAVTMLPLSGTESEVLAIVRDLTQVRETSSALAETQALASIGHWAWDMEADRITWTEELYRIFGVDPESWPATYESYSQRLHPDDRAHVEATVQAAVEDASDYTLQHRIVRPDGTVRVVSSTGRVVTDATGSPIRLAGTAQDITERIEAEDEAMRLREAHARHEQGLELNDNVMQGLAVARLALMEGDEQRALATLDRTMEAAREIIRSLLEVRTEGDGGLRPGDLVRSRGALQRDES